MRRRGMKTFLGILGGVALSALPASVYAADVTYDLTTAGASSGVQTSDNGKQFIVTQIDPQSTGTGVIDSFLRIQQTGSEAGYNTSLGTPLDDKGGGFTRALTLGEVPIVNIGGVDYYQFLLDINQLTAGDNELLSLNQIQIFTAGSDQLHTSYAPASSTPTAANIGFASATEVFRMSSIADGNFQQILLNYSLNPGSGAGDMFLYVAKSAFGAASATTNVILFSQFGTPNGVSSSNDGFEEWAVLKGNLTQCQTCNLDEVPEPASLMLLGSGLAVAAARFRRKVARRA